MFSPKYYEPDWKSMAFAVAVVILLLIGVSLICGCSSTLSPIETSAIAQEQSLVTDFESEITGFLPLTPPVAQRK